jgi:signal transduction histidine kinase
VTPEGNRVEGIRVVIAEDEPAVRDALADLVDSAPDMQVVGVASDADEAIELSLAARPDIALLDVKMPGGGGPRAAREIRAGSPETRVIALSAYDDRGTVVDMLRAGVAGYVVKGVPGTEIVDSLRRAVRGQGVLSVDVTADVIHELVAHLERSERLAADLRQLDRMKSELIQVLAHELFTPITTIQGFAMTVSEHGEALAADDVQELAAGVERASRRLRRLVGNLRAAAQLDREGVELGTRPVRIGEILDRATTEFENGARLRALPGEAVRNLPVWADAELATRALSIVVENALDLTSSGDPIELGATETALGEVAITVSDRGPGVPPEMQDQIFDAFTQAEDSMTRRHEGLGIGLFLARRIMHALGGEIRAAEREGGGSVFTLTFVAIDERSPVESAI